MPDGLKFIRPKRTLSFAGSLISDVTTPCATAILFCTAQLLPKPVHCALLVHESNGSSSQFFGGLVSKFSRLPRLRRDSRSSVSSPDGRRHGVDEAVLAGAVVDDPVGLDVLAGAVRVDVAARDAALVAAARVDRPRGVAARVDGVRVGVVGLQTHAARVVEHDQHVGIDLRSREDVGVERQRRSHRRANEADCKQHGSATNALKDPSNHVRLHIMQPPDRSTPITTHSPHTAPASRLASPPCSAGRGQRASEPSPRRS